MQVLNPIKIAFLSTYAMAAKASLLTTSIASITFNSDQCRLLNKNFRINDFHKPPPFSLFLYNDKI
jgi:hypothetical protein